MNLGACEQCPAGALCDTPGLTLATLNVKRGWWRTSRSTANILRCPDASSKDTACIGGALGDLCKPWSAAFERRLLRCSLSRLVGRGAQDNRSLLFPLQCH